MPYGLSVQTERYVAFMISFSLIFLKSPKQFRDAYNGHVGQIPTKAKHFFFIRDTPLLEEKCCREKKMFSCNR